jgi:nucleoside-diphosphate-sugar epimerase
MTIMVTGATGFIGSHLCRHLLQKNHEVMGLTRSGKLDNIGQFSGNTGFKVTRGNIRDSTVVCNLISENHIDTLFHLAARLPSDKDRDNPADYFDTNLYGTLNLLEAASSSGVKTFIYASTMSVYSEPPEYLPVNETHPTRPATAYGISKLGGELCCHLYDSRMRIIILRLGGVYGLNCHESDVVPRFIKQALENRPLTVFGNGKQSSDFVYIDDAISGILSVWEKGEPGVYNIGGGEETGILELADQVIEITRSNSKVQLTGKETDRPFRFVMDITRARKLHGYSPRTLKDGLRRYLREIGHDI